MTTTTDYPFTPGDLAGLRSACAAVVAAPGDDRYDEEVATWNLAVRLRPDLVVGARTADDVVNAVRWAARLGVAVGVNATGHGAVPNTDGALLVNTSRLAQVIIDPVSATATVGAGARMGDVTAAAARYGLTPIQGSSGSAGAAGFTLGGGLGVMSRTFGLAADRVLSIDVVTSDGQLRTVGADHHPELFWALRGGKGNFGVVTSYRTALEPLSAFYGGGIFFDGAHAADVLHAYRRWITGLTEQTSSSVALLHLPADPAVPEAIRSRYVAHLRLAHIGDSAEGARLADCIRGVAPVLLDALGELPVTALDLVHQDPPAPVPVHERGCLLDQLTPDTIDAVVREASAPGSPLMLAEIRQLGGAIARDPAVPNAVPGRTVPFVLFAIALDIPPLAGAGPRAVAALLEAVRPWRSPVTFPNFLGRSCTPAEVQAAWPDQTRARLLDIKQGWDLDNVFRVGHALLPAPAPTRLAGEQLDQGVADGPSQTRAVMAGRNCPSGRETKIPRPMASSGTRSTR